MGSSTSPKPPHPPHPPHLPRQSRTGASTRIAGAVVLRRYLLEIAPLLAPPDPIRLGSLFCTTCNGHYDAKGVHLAGRQQGREEVRTPHAGEPEGSLTGGSSVPLLLLARDSTAMATDLRSPFPWFGGKSRVAGLVWDRFGDVPNYVEPFFGSGAVLFGRPHRAAH